uniref:Helicase ATP-binding domain-containing protein n=1 Tax=Aegilops tauschii subsp. strangulata TaxID=200361 RepID=A0A453PN87_AEGTS
FCSASKPRFSIPKNSPKLLTPTGKSTRFGSHFERSHSPEAGRCRRGASATAATATPRRRRRRSSPSPPTPTSRSPRRSAGRRRPTTTTTASTWRTAATRAASRTRLRKGATAMTATATAGGQSGAGGVAPRSPTRRGSRRTWTRSSVSDAAAIARKPFKPPCGNGYSENSELLARRLSARKRFVPWGSAQPFAVPNNLQQLPTIASDDSSEKEEPLPPGIEPLILWQPEECDKENNNFTAIEVDHLLVRYLRPHQREGVQFMFDCVSGLLSDDGIAGCILADDMGLGKTLQSITLLYTLLAQGFEGKPMVKRAVIVTPTSLVSNWESEISKWLKGKVHLLALCESTRADVLSGIGSFLKPLSRLQVLIVSYETFRMHSSKFEIPGSCDLLICDEAHRLKNDQTLTNKALAALPCTRRILLSGTPMQNDLEEFFSMVNFTNPGVLGDAAYFRRYYEAPIIRGREPTATAEEKKLGSERSGQLSAKVNQFILRRTNALLSNHLPPKIVEVVCCKLTPLQMTLYNHFIHSKNVKRLISEEAKSSKVLAYITALKKLCNHPKLIYDTIKSSKSGGSGFDDCLRFFPPELFQGRYA